MGNMLDTNAFPSSSRKNYINLLARHHQGLTPEGGGGGVPHRKNYEPAPAIPYYFPPVIHISLLFPL